MSNESKLKRRRSLQSHISQFPVRVRILALVLVPLVGLLFVGFQELSLEYGEAAENSRALMLTENIPDISALIHEMQKERGISAGFISSGGQKFGVELNAQHRSTDAGLDELRIGMDKLRQMGMESEIIAQLTRALSALDKLGAMQAEVSGLQVPGSDMGDYYTGTIAELLGIVELQVSNSGEPAMVQKLRAVNNLLQAKERAGIERAVGAQVFSAGEMNVSESTKFIGTIRLQDYLLEDFIKGASDPLVTLYERTMTGPVIDKLNSYRDVLRGASFGGSLASVTSEQWFAAATDRINLLKTIDDAATTEIAVAARDMEAASWQKFRVSSIVNAAILILTGVLAFLVVRSITGPLNRLTRTMDDLTEDNYDITVADTENGDLLGQMARAVEVFRQNGLKVQELEKATASQLVVAADHSGQIAAISKAQAVIEFTVEGEIVSANENFLAATGYTLEEIKGRHHSIFVDPDFVKSADYKIFWQKLGRGEYDEGEYERFGRGGKRVWLQASYNPIVGPDGQLTKIVKYATDVTPRKDAMENLDQGLKKLAEGDLMSRINSPLSGEFEEVRTAFNHTVDRLTDIVGQLRDTSGALKTATGEILAGANDLSERTTKQAATVEETSATMEQLSGTVAASAAQADDASTRSHNLAKTAEETGSVVHKAT